MGVSLPQGGGRGGKRGLGADLNLVPFIDLMSTCITFLLATAVWTQTSTIDIEQAIGEPPPAEPDKKPINPLMVHISDGGVWLGRETANGKFVPRLPTGYDWDSIDRELKADHAQFPTETQCTIRTDDGVVYEHMIKALDLARTIGYDKTLLAGGPPDAPTLGSATPRR
jgi:biopolymer transport protein ExbD